MLKEKKHRRVVIIDKNYTVLKDVNSLNKNVTILFFSIKKIDVQKLSLLLNTQIESFTLNDNFDSNRNLKYQVIEFIK